MSGIYEFTCEFQDAFQRSSRYSQAIVNMTKQFVKNFNLGSKGKHRVFFFSCLSFSKVLLLLIYHPSDFWFLPPHKSS